MADEDIWKKRFFILTAVRLSGIPLIALGLMIAMTDTFVPGGHRLAGALVIVLGTIDSAFAPYLLRKAWKGE